MTVEYVHDGGPGLPETSPPCGQASPSGPHDVKAAASQLATERSSYKHISSLGHPNNFMKSLNRKRRALLRAVCPAKVSHAMEYYLTSMRWLLISVVMTLFCLYAVDVCDVAVGSTTARTVVSALLLFCFIAFGLEVVLGSIFVDKYFLSFFFWVDIAGTVSLILDIQWLAAELLNEEEGQALQITRAGRAARIGAQIGRITRVLRVLRLFRVLRLLKVLQMRKRKLAGMDTVGAGDNGPIQPTVLGELLAESTTRKCIVIILFVLIISTFLQTSYPEVADYNRMQLLSYGLMTPESFVVHSPYPVIYLNYLNALNGSLVEFVPYGRTRMRTAMQFRTQVECVRYNGTDLLGCGWSDSYSKAWYDVSHVVQLNAAFNIILTSVIIACLGLSAYLFGKDATTYVIVPIETMLKYLRRHLMVGTETDRESEAAGRKPPETDLLANYVSRLVDEIDFARQKAEEEARISDTLLNSMVPPRIARQLKELRWWEAGPEQRAMTIADSFQHATVLFTDIVGFTTLSSRISAEEAMRHLNSMYTVFDEIVEKYGLYKVETIGDSYMLVGGAPDEQLDHAERVAAAALEIRGCVPLLQEISGEPEINVRIGMHSGHVTAGVVGFKNPRWHLFGDTCNTASRMESTGMAGEVQLSSSTFELIKDKGFVCKVRGKVAVKGKGEMVTYLLTSSVEHAALRRTESTAGGSHYAGGARAPSFPSVDRGAEVFDREAFLTSPQFKKAMERYTAARNSLLTEEEELCKLMRVMDEAEEAAAGAGAGTAAAAAAAVAAAAEAGSGTVADAQTPQGAAEGVAAAGVVVPRLAAGLSTAAFKRMVLGPLTPSDLKALALHLHEDLAVARSLSSAAAAEKAEGLRRDLLLRLYGRVLEAPGLTLRDTFTYIVDTLYKVVECDVIKLYVVDHARGQLWPASRHSAADANKVLPLDGTLAGAAVRRAAVLRVDDVAAAAEYNAELEELPAGYASKSMMVIPVMGAGPLLGPANDWHTSSGGATAAAVSADVMAVIVAVNRWTGWDEAGGEEGERRIVPFTAADEEGMREVAASVGLLLARRRGEVLLASAAPGGAAAASFAVAAVPYSVARQRLRHVARRGSKEVADVRGNLWAMRHEELLGQARDVLLALHRLCAPTLDLHLLLFSASRPPTTSGALPLPSANGFIPAPATLGNGPSPASAPPLNEEVLVSFLLRCAAEQSSGQFFNLAHSVNALQGVYLTLRTQPELVALLGPHHLLALLLAAALANVARDGDAGVGLSPAASHALGGGAGAGPGAREGGAGWGAGVGGTSSGALSVSGRNSRQSAVAARTGAGSVSVLGQHSQQHLGGGAGEDRSVKGAVRRVQVSQGGEDAASAHLASGTLHGVERESVQGGDGGTGQLPLPPTPFAEQQGAVGAAAGAGAGVLTPAAVADRGSPTGILRERLAARAEAAAAAGRAASLDITATYTLGQGTAPAGGDEDSMPLGPMPHLRRIDPQLALSGSSAAEPPGSPGPGSFSGPYGSGASVGALGGASPAAVAVVSGLPRVRGVSTRRTRLAVVVDEVLMAGEGGVLRGLSPGDAAAVRQLVVVLLALRGQPWAVLSLAQQLRQPGQTVGGGQGSRKASTAGVDAGATRVEGCSELAAGGKADASEPEDAAGADAEGGEEASARDRANPKTAADEAVLAQMLQACGDDDVRQAELRTAACALLLHAWCESCHTKDTATALSLLVGRSADVRKWSQSQLPPNTSRRRSMELLGGPFAGGPDDVHGLLLLEVPRIQLEVIPLWSRAAELLPRLRPQLDAVHANRTAYLAMLQTATSAPSSPAAPAPGSDPASASAAAAAAAPPSTTTPGAAAASAIMSRNNTGIRSPHTRSPLGSIAAGSGSIREPRRFISVKQRASPVSSVSRNALLPPALSGEGHLDTSPAADTLSGSGGAFAGPHGHRAFVRASSTRSHVGTGDIDSDFAFGAGSARDLGIGVTGGTAPSPPAAAGGSTGPLPTAASGVPVRPSRLAGVSRGDLSVGQLGAVSGTMAPVSGSSTAYVLSAAATPTADAPPSRLQSGRLADGGTAPSPSAGVVGPVARRGSIGHRLQGLFAAVRSPSSRHHRPASSHESLAGPPGVLPSPIERGGGGGGGQGGAAGAQLGVSARRASLPSGAVAVDIPTLAGVASRNGAAGSRGPFSSSIGQLAYAPSVPIHPEPWSPAPGAPASRGPHAHSHASPFPFTRAPSMPRAGPIPATSSAPLNGARPAGPSIIGVAVGPADAAHSVRRSTSGAVAGAGGAVPGAGGPASGHGSLMSRLRGGLALHFRRSGSNRVHLHSSSAPSSPPLGAMAPTGQQQHPQYQQHQYQQQEPDTHESQMAFYNNALLLSSSHMMQPHSSTHAQLAAAFSDPAAHTLAGRHSSRSLLALPTQLSLASSHSQVLTPADAQPAAAAAHQPAPPALTHTRSSSETTALAAHHPYEPFDPLPPGPELSLSNPEAPGHNTMGGAGLHTGALSPVPELTNSGHASSAAMTPRTCSLATPPSLSPYAPSPQPPPRTPPPPAAPIPPSHQAAGAPASLRHSNQPAVAVAGEQPPRIQAAHVPAASQQAQGHISAGGGGGGSSGGGAPPLEDAAGAPTAPSAPAALTAAVEPLAAAARAVREAAAAAAETLTQRQAAVQLGTWLGVRLATGVAASATPPLGAGHHSSSAHPGLAEGPAKGVAAAGISVTRSARHSSTGSIPAGPRRSATASLQEVILKAEVALGGQQGAEAGERGAVHRRVTRDSAGVVEGGAVEWGGGAGGNVGSEGGE